MLTFEYFKNIRLRATVRPTSMHASRQNVYTHAAIRKEQLFLRYSPPVTTFFPANSQSNGEYIYNNPLLSEIEFVN